MPFGINAGLEFNFIVDSGDRRGTVFSISLDRVSVIA
jgi:hypothetical protein